MLLGGRRQERTNRTATGALKNPWPPRPPRTSARGLPATDADDPPGQLHRGAARAVGLMESPYPHGSKEDPPPPPLGRRWRILSTAATCAGDKDSGSSRNRRMRAGSTRLKSLSASSGSSAACRAFRANSQRRSARRSFGIEGVYQGFRRARPAGTRVRRIGRTAYPRGKTPSLAGAAWRRLGGAFRRAGRLCYPFGIVLNLFAGASYPFAGASYPFAAASYPLAPRPPSRSPAR